jgi:hypothetical protein
MLQFGKNKEYWISFRNDPKKAELIDSLKAEYKASYKDAYRGEEIPQLRYSIRMLHDRVGSRREFEVVYSGRRHCLSACALLSAIYPESEEYFNNMQDLIFAICEEWSWEVPAHTFNAGENGIDGDTQIALCSAETALMLAEIYYLHEDRLEPIIKTCIKRECERRIFTPFENNHYWYEDCTHNWAPVCSGNVAGAMIYLAPERFDKNKERLLRPLKNFIDAQPSDGTCLEGVSYWQYGFGFYAMTADIIYKYSDGEIDLFNLDPKVKKIAQYPSHAFLKGYTSISNADCTPDGRVDKYIIQFLRTKFGSDVPLLPEQCYGYGVGSGVGWLTKSRRLLYSDFEELSAGALQSADLFDAGQIIVHEDKYSLFVKGGDNAEPHNHNDLGSFIISTDKGEIFPDLGAGLYVYGYFVPETRYNYLCNSSRGHSVPIINGQYQVPAKDCEESSHKAGATEHAILTHEAGVITVDYTVGYDIEGLECALRSFTHSADSIIMRDAFKGKIESVTERFVSLIKPTEGDGYIEISGVRMYYDKANCILKITEDTESYINHKCEVTPPVATPVFLIDFELKDLRGAEFRFTF